MNLQFLSNDHLESRFQKLVKTERKITHLVLQCIAEIDRRKLYLERAYPSLFEFLVQAYGYSASAAMRRIDGARLLQQIPEVAEQIENGSVNLSQVALLQRAEREVRRNTKSMVPVELKRELLEKIENQSQAKTEQLIAQAFNIEMNSKNKTIQNKDESVTITMTLTKEQMVELEQVQAHLSHVVPEKNWASLVSYLVKKELSRLVNKKSSHQLKKPICNEEGNVKEIVEEKLVKQSLKINDAEMSTLSAKEQPIDIGAEFVTTATVAINTTAKRKPLPQSLKRQLIDINARCVYRDPCTGKTCGSRHFLQVDHIQSVSRGGGNDPANLQVLCGQHNRYKYVLENKK